MDKDTAKYLIELIGILRQSGLFLLPDDCDSRFDKLGSLERQIRIDSGFDLTSQ